MLTCDNKNCGRKSDVEQCEAGVCNIYNRIMLGMPKIDLCQGCQKILTHKIGFLVDVMMGVREQSEEDIFV